MFHTHIFFYNDGIYLDVWKDHLSAWDPGNCFRAQTCYSKMDSQTHREKYQRPSAVSNMSWLCLKSWQYLSGSYNIIPKVIFIYRVQHKCQSSLPLWRSRIGGQEWGLGCSSEDSRLPSTWSEQTPSAP